MVLRNSIFLILSLAICSGVILIDRFILVVPDAIAIVLILVAGGFLILHWRLRKELKKK